MSNAFTEIYNTTSMLYINEQLVDISTRNRSVEMSDIDILYQSVKALSLLKMTKDMIDSAYIFPNYGELVISDKGTENADIFFNDSHRYEEYSLDYWKNLKPPGNQEFSLLKATTVYKGGGTGIFEKVIPVVQPGLGRFPSENLFVIDVKESEMYRILNRYKFTPNSILYMTDSDGNVLTSTDREDVSFPITDKAMIEKAKENESYMFYADIKGQKMLSIIKTSKMMNKQYFYISCTPLQDLYKKSYQIKLFTYITGTVTFLLVGLISFFIAKRLYNPIKNLANVMKEKMGVNPMWHDEYYYLNERIYEIFNDSDSLRKDLSIALPMACEQYLLKILNHNEFLDEEKITELLSKWGITFKNEYFSVVVLKQEFTKAFYNSFDREEQMLIYNGSIEIITNLFPEEYQISVLTLEDDKLCLIINIPQGESVQAIEKLIHKFYQLFNYDECYLKMYTGIGQPYEGFEGMHQSYREASEAMNLLSGYSEDRIKIYNDRKNGAKYYFTFDEENKLYNYLFGGYRENVETLLRAVINKNVESSISSSCMKELYLQFYIIGQRVLKNKNLSAEKMMEEQYINLLTDYNRLNLNEILDYITELFSRITEAGSSRPRKVDSDLIKEYIEAHYNEDIYLEKLADEYNVAVSYLSRLCKNSFGITFQQYLANARINRAKELLVTTKKTVNEIAELSGFNSRNTFIRMFKKLEGVLPSKYREMMKNSHKQQ